MVLFPVIDMLGGRVVRLFQGDYEKQTEFGKEPAAFAKLFQQQGAGYLHLVDLDGAKQGAPCNFAAVQGITAQTNLFCELGGGIRTEENVQACLDAGVGRVILGTAALKDPAFTKAMVQKHGGKIAVGVDARDGKVAIEGWLATSDVDSFDFCREMRATGVEYIIYTDISRDGAGQGTNLAAYEKLTAIDGLHITASGGVSTLGDIARLREMGLYAAIVGKALYTGDIKLEEALAVAGGEKV